MVEAASTPLSIRRRHAAESVHVWDKEETDDLWVHGALGNALLSKASPKHHAEGSPSSWAVPTSHASVGTSMEHLDASTHTIPWHQKCKASSKEHQCFCRRFDPVLMLPLTLFGRLEISSELRSFAYQLAELAGKTGALGMEASDLEVDVQETTTPVAGPSHAICFRVRKLRRHLVAEGARSGAYRDAAGHEAALALARLDRAEFEANMRMLPELLQFCNQYRAVKTHNVDEAKWAAVRRFDAEIDREMRKTGIAEGMASLATNPEQWRAASEDLESELTRHTFSSTFGCTQTITAGFEKRAPRRPLIVCRCGHAEMWHERPFDPASIGDSNRSLVAARPYQRGLQRRSASASTLDSKSQDKTATLAGGTLRKAGVSLLAMHLP
mmetsp:Transcript_107424/g.213284  ORF Transcript_107424/g.213284 Transcript_107424/m.213284 type:complete len:384 (-) Transcript_107424:13-1164(-)|eukprot:CAMPEP_0172861168 /NCGR_PEP_ID=MMETSP1075-20121228/72504_1 /TAXON_ID=2916 /ORGANISM="Ceratium fusus, Strain PA161109" /LENGTH=383 /DNA_ID=CAMNT_0013709281 /DNA_START=40 /DNA_END=1191 /DNA_ORIENTATION=+